jgi:ATP-dependent dihydroxyacetone kinase
MEQFINTKETLVHDAIDGFLRISGSPLSRLDGYPHIKVVIRTDWDKSKVALVSGGGSGHEPAHPGFVGRGMLTAAVCGDVFASPSTDAVLAGILSVTGDAGCLLIVKNYTGDRLNFGLAAERARALGLKVNMVVVDDDIALPDIAQARGLAGTLFVHKIAGALAEQGADLKAVTDASVRVITDVTSIGMSLDTCTVPGTPKEKRIGAGKAELGLGIHGEPGVEQVDFENARSAMEMVLDRLAPKLTSHLYVALLNNLGGSTTLEMSVLANELCRSKISAQIGHIVGPAPLMTSLDMHGFSMSLLPVDQAQLEALLAPVATSAWPGCSVVGDVKTTHMPSGLETPKYRASDHSATRVLLSAACTALVSAENELNALDAKSGDGDTGSTVKAAAQSLADAIDQLPLADTAELLRAIGSTLSQSMGGSSGVILAIFFSSAGHAAANGKTLSEALISGLERIQDVGGAQLGDRTMIDALAPALDALPHGLVAAAQAARHGADATAQMTRARAGRATYVSASNLVGHNDPGAEAVALLFEHLVKAQ